MKTNDQHRELSIDIMKNCKAIDDFLGYTPSFCTRESKRSNKQESIAVKAIPATMPILF